MTAILTSYSEERAEHMKIPSDYISPRKNLLHTNLSGQITPKAIIDTWHIDLKATEFST